MTDRDTAKRKRREAVFVYGVMVLCLYLITASWLFALRHPWMTDTERFLNTHKALTFQRVYKPRNR